jgi:glycerophosphoryl diester phosphodiesterase
MQMSGRHRRRRRVANRQRAAAVMVGVTAAAMTAVSAVAIGPAWAGTPLGPQRPSFLRCPPVVAHRGTGAGIGVSGGTVAGFAGSLKDGGQILEMDVRFTANGTPVVYHDATIDADTNGRGAVAGFTSWAALSKYRIDGSRQPIPTLYQVLQATHAQAKQFVIEFKTDPTPSQLATYMTRIDAFGLRSELIVESTSAQTLREVSAAHPDLRTALISSVRLPADEVRQSGTAYLPNQKIVDPTYVAELHAAGVTTVYPWTVNTVQGWTAMNEAGVDGILTDLTKSYLDDCDSTSPVLNPVHPH